MKRIGNVELLASVLTIITGCQPAAQQPVPAAAGNVKLITLDPGHFHAALVQKSMYPGIDSVVHVYGPKGFGVDEQLNYIKQYNSQAERPTAWSENVYTGDDYLQRMLDEKKGNVVVIAGNNMRKSEYIKKSVDNRMNVLADKPMAITAAGFDTLRQAFADAKSKGVLLYDIMTERSEITSILQKKLAHTAAVFGDLQPGTADSPAVKLESVHRYLKSVSGKPLLRPDWFFDPLQGGDAIVDVGTHLVDLVQWTCFPEVSLAYDRDIQIASSKIWPTPLTLSEFARITQENQFPDFLKKYVKDDSVLLAHGNGTINYTIKRIHASVTAKWTYQAPAGAGDTYTSLFTGSKARLEIRQGQEEAWKSTLYVWPVHPARGDSTFVHELGNAIREIGQEFPGVSLEKYKNGWKIIIPEKFALGHESHFAEVMKRYLQFLKEGKLPDWEEAGMIAKYFTTTKGLEMAQQ